MNDQDIEVPKAWQEMELGDLRGPLLVVGGPDVGKSTFARYLYRRISEKIHHSDSDGSNSNRSSAPVAFLDGDPGQTSLGPPTTMTLAFEIDQLPSIGRGESAWRYFVGSNTPVGHMLAVLVGAGRLIEAGRSSGAEAIIYDTSGFISKSRGGYALKYAEFDLLRPEAVFMLQKEDELSDLIRPLKRSERTRVFDLRPSEAVKTRSSDQRRKHRRRQYARHFEDAERINVKWTDFGVFPSPNFRLHRLVSLEDKNGFTLALGIITAVARSTRKIELLTPLTSLQDVSTIRLGDITVDPESFEDQWLSRQ